MRMFRLLSSIIAALAVLTTQALALDCSGTTTASSKALFTNTAKKGFMVYNTSANLECIAFDGPAAMGSGTCPVGSYPLYPGTLTNAGVAGNSFSSPANWAPSSVNIISSAGGDTYSCTLF